MKIGKDHFSGASNMYGSGNKSLTTAIRGLAIDLARLRIEAMTGSDLQFTDNSTGTDGGSVVALTTPVAAVSATGANAAAVAALNTALGKSQNALRVMGTLVNLARARLGLNPITFAGGTVATPGTIPAQDKTIATATGTSAADHASGIVALDVTKEKLRRLTWHMNEVLIAIGEAPIVTEIKGQPPTMLLSVTPTVDASAATGIVALDRTQTNAFLLALANNVKSLSVKWNAAMADIDDGTSLSVLAS
jgi:hypothetical protein